MTDEDEQRCEEKPDAWLRRTLRQKVKSRPLGLTHQRLIALSHFSMNSDRVRLRRTACHGTLDGGAFTEILGIVPRHTPPQSKAATRNLPTTSLGRTNLVKGPRLLRTIDPHQQVEPVIRLSARTSVPRFYFHLRNDMDVPDDEGKDLPDLEVPRSVT